jgi:peptidoglycan/LPS O-acetylase OafA/YrhL
MGNGKRLLFFDVLRIVSVAMVVLFHVAMYNDWSLLEQTTTVFNVFYLNPGSIGVAILIFVSGAVLEYAHPKLENFDDIYKFYVKRLFRIYPAFWMSLIIALTYSPNLLITLPPTKIFTQFTGFNAWTGQWSGPLNSVGWFIGLIVVLYFLYPFLSASIRKYPYIMLILIAAVEIFARYFLYTIPFPNKMIFPGIQSEKWIPFCNFLEFGLGIFIVQQNFYPKWTYDNRWLWFFAELSFYVFLIHSVGLLGLASISIIIYIPVVILFAWLMMLGDQKIQVFLKKAVGMK